MRLSVKNNISDNYQVYFRGNEVHNAVLVNEEKKRLIVYDYNKSKYVRKRGEVKLIPTFDKNYSIYIKEQKKLQKIANLLCKRLYLKNILVIINKQDISPTSFYCSDYINIAIEKILKNKCKYKAGYNLLYDLPIKYHVLVVLCHELGHYFISAKHAKWNINNNFERSELFADKIAHGLIKRYFTVIYKKYKNIFKRLKDLRKYIDS